MKNEYFIAEFDLKYIENNVIVVAVIFITCLFITTQHLNLKLIVIIVVIYNIECVLFIFYGFIFTLLCVFIFNVSFILFSFLSSFFSFVFN